MALLSVFTDLSRRFFVPIDRNRGFFAAALLLCAVAPALFSVWNHAMIMWLFMMALLEGCFTAYLLCLVSWRYVRWALLCLLSLWSLVEVGTVATTGEPITFTSVLLMMETNPSEIIGFFHQYFTVNAIMTILAVAVLVALCAVVIVRVLHRFVFVIMLAVAAGALAVASLMGSLFTSDISELLVWEGQTDAVRPSLMRSERLRLCSPIPKLAFIGKSMWFEYGVIEQWERTQREASVDSNVACDDHGFNLLVIIGESFIRSHSQFYGYYLPTNPGLMRERDAGRLVVFDDVWTSANFTTVSIRNMLNLNDTAADEQWYSGVYFPYLLRQGGWRVYHFDNQTVSTSSDVGISRMIYSDFNMVNTYCGVSDTLFDYDGDFAYYVSSLIPDSIASGGAVVFYHLMGQHFAASDRFTGDGRFTAVDITVDRPWLDDNRRQEIADYDNATVYNDSVVCALLAPWADTPTLALYFPDHGEDMWDLAPMEARNRPAYDDKAWIERQFHIPFVAWMSDSFREEYPDLEKRLRDGASNRVSLDNLGQMILGLTSLSTKYYIPARDPLAGI